MNTFKLASVLCCLFIMGCSTVPPEETAQMIIDKSITAHGGEAYDNLNVSFVFRDKNFSIKHNEGQFEYSRSFSDSLGTYLDVLTNDGFTRTLNGELVELSEKDENSFSNSVNSVVYFTLLPKGLNDKAVNKKLLGTIKIKGQDYHFIGTTFDEEGGGEDHDDTFGYWVNTQTNTMDYLAYSYHTNGGGVRFRAAMNPIEVEGVQFQNYINYKPASKTTPLDSLPYLFEQGELKKLSEIINEEVKGLN